LNSLSVLVGNLEGKESLEYLGPGGKKLLRHTLINVHLNRGLNLLA